LLPGLYGGSGWDQDDTYIRLGQLFSKKVGFCASSDSHLNRLLEGSLEMNERCDGICTVCMDDERYISLEPE